MYILDSFYSRHNESNFLPERFIINRLSLFLQNLKIKSQLQKFNNENVSSKENEK